MLTAARGWSFQHNEESGRARLLRRNPPPPLPLAAAAAPAAGAGTEGLPTAGSGGGGAYAPLPLQPVPRGQDSLQLFGLEFRGSALVRNAKKEVAAHFRRNLYECEAVCTLPPSFDCQPPPTPPARGSRLGFGGGSGGGGGEVPEFGVVSPVRNQHQLRGKIVFTLHNADIAAKVDALSQYAPLLVVVVKMAEGGTPLKDLPYFRGQGRKTKSATRLQVVDTAPTGGSMSQDSGGMAAQALKMPVVGLECNRRTGNVDTRSPAVQRLRRFLAAPDGAEGPGTSGGEPVASPTEVVSAVVFGGADSVFSGRPGPFVHRLELWKRGEVRQSVLAGTKVGA
eukprot:SAG22_NODE_2354_length_2674_cov_1.317282_2_plen_338_part_00